MSETRSSKDAITRISQFIVRKESAALAKSCQRSLIETVLFNHKDNGLSIPEIPEEISEQMGLKGFPASVIEDVIESPEGKEEIYEKDNRYFLENDVYENMKQIIAEKEKAIDHFEAMLTAKVKEKAEKVKTGENISDLAVKSVYEFLVTWFSSESSFIANFLKTKKQLELPDPPANILSEVLTRVQGANDRQVIHDAIMETFKDLETNLGRLLFEILQSYIHLELLNVDPDCRYLEKIAFSNKTLVLDTNVLMALLLEAQTAHDGVNETISIAKDLGVTLVMTKRTENEWLWSLEEANGQFQSLNREKPSLLPRVENVFIKSFFKRKTIESSLTWESFYLQLRQIKSMIRDKGIVFWYKKEFDLDQLPNKEFFEPLWGKVYACASMKGYPKPKSVSEHDAYHLLLVRKLREEHESDILGPSCWFLTLDTTLYCADEGLNQFMHAPFDPPSSFMADMWVPIIAPFIGAEVSEERLADAFAHLMSTRFAVMPSGLNANAVIEVLGHWLPDDKLSSKEIEAILADALVTKYYEELKEARIKDPRKIEELVEKLHQKVDEKVYGIFDERISEANLQREKAEKVVLDKEEQLVAETRRRKLILKICLVFGVVFTGLGMVFLAINNLATGTALTTPGIVFIVLSLGFRHVKLKTGPIELEADQ